MAIECWLTRSMGVVLNCDGMQASVSESKWSDARLCVCVCVGVLFRLSTVICGCPKNQTTIFRSMLTDHSQTTYVCVYCIVLLLVLWPDLSLAAHTHTHTQHKLFPCQFDTFITVYFIICLGRQQYGEKRVLRPILEPNMVKFSLTHRHTRCCQSHSMCVSAFYL